MAMTTDVKPSLFGLQNSNRNFAKADAWGKNQFNSSFPASLVSWMGMENLKPIYLCLDKAGNVRHDEISVQTLFGLPANHTDLFFQFEDAYTPYSDLIVGSIPRADLVTRNSATSGKDAFKAFEIKLTALPDSTTFSKSNEALWGCELVVRPDTIVYIALSIAQGFRNHRPQLLNLLLSVGQSISNWQNGQDVRPHMPTIIDMLERLLLSAPESETPLLLQPVFKTQGKKSALTEQCFDCFVWSNFALAKLFINQSKNNENNITRHERSSIWLFKMLLDYASNGRIDAKEVIDSLTYNSKNDKAFASSGSVTNPYMRCATLEHPRVSKLALREIILGGGQHFLSPERRLDAIIVNTPGLFD
jgi:HindVP restriction endonuclease